jgi:hypothetical protein
MPRTNLLPSPCAEIVLSAYEEGAFPKFAELFQAFSSPSSLLRHLAFDPDEASAAIVLDNQSAKAVSALRYRWGITDESGKQIDRTTSSDSYMVDVYRAVAVPGSRHLISPTKNVDDALIEHVRAGGGLIGASLSTRGSPEIAALSFEIDFILFEDGEVAGPDWDRFAQELQCRKPAAEFVARQIRLAMDENRDVTPVLSALVEIPSLGRLGQVQGDPLVHWTRHYARDYLSAMQRTGSGIDWKQAKLRHLESRPELPKFYRREQ